MVDSKRNDSLAYIGAERIVNIVNPILSQLVFGGWEIKPGKWIDSHSRSCCVLGAVHLWYGQADTVYVNVARALSVSRDWIYDFSRGFEAEPIVDIPLMMRGAWRLGKQYRISLGFRP